MKRGVDWFREGTVAPSDVQAPRGMQRHLDDWANRCRSAYRRCHPIGGLPIGDSASSGVFGPLKKPPSDGGGNRPPRHGRTAGRSPVTPTHQPLPALVAAASTTPAQDAGPARLLRLWAQLACRVIAAEAHDSDDQQALRNALCQMEDAFAERFPAHRALLSELAVLESLLLPPGRHVDPADVPAVPTGPPGAPAQPAPAGQPGGWAMSVTVMPSPGRPPVTVDGDRLLIYDLAVVHSEAANVARSQLSQSGSEGLADLIRRALPVGLVALSMGGAALDTGAIQRTLDAFAEHVDVRSRAALTGLDQTLSRLQAGEQAVSDTAAQVLARLPEQVGAALGGQAGTVRAAVVEAARSAQSSALEDLRAALAANAAAVRDAVSLDREGPVQVLRRDVLDQIGATRRELADQLAAVRSLLTAAEARKDPAVKTTRASGVAFEEQALKVAESVVLGCGDLWAETASESGVGTTRRSGDAVATLSPAVRGMGSRPSGSFWRRSPAPAPCPPRG